MMKVVIFFVAVLVAAVSSAALPLSTVAITHVDGGRATLVCAIVYTNTGDRKLNCTRLPQKDFTVYPSAEIPYNAIAAGDGFLCGLMAPPGGRAAMRWWTLDGAQPRPQPTGRRLYWGAQLLSMSAGGRHVCGLTGPSTTDCWPSMSLPADARHYTQVAVGAAFVCGLSDDSTIRCFGNETSIVGSEPEGNYTLVAAGHSHACAVAADGKLLCWGRGAPAITGPLPATLASMALGNNRTCVLSGSGNVHCWGSGASPPPAFAGEEFVALEAAGEAICGVLAANYSVVCWGNDHFQRINMVYTTAMPGACSRQSDCSSCGVVPGSGDLCGPGTAVCSSCKIALASTSPTRPSNSTAVEPQQEAALTGWKLGLVVAAAGVALVALLGIATAVALRRRSGSGADQTVDIEMEYPLRSTEMQRPKTTKAIKAGFGCEEISLWELRKMTEDFSESRLIGTGSYGSVYRAALPDGREVAIKRGTQRRRGRRRREAEERAFRSELALLSRVNHRNLVRLYGFCQERGERILVLELMPRGSLDDHLHGNAAGASPLSASWAARLRVALDAARGVEYLHRYAVPPVIHRDIKPSNILLDADWTAKVSDFGVGILAVGPMPPAVSTAGTLGYMDPEYYRLQRLTESSDVYSFGVVLLELLSGRRAISRGGADGSGSPRNVVEIAVPAVDAGEAARVLDPALPAPRQGKEAEAVGVVALLAAECVRQRAHRRPAMSEVVAELEWAVGLLCEDEPGPPVRPGPDSFGRSDRSDWSDRSAVNFSEPGLGSSNLTRFDSTA